MKEVKAKSSITSVSHCYNEVLLENFCLLVFCQNDITALIRAGPRLNNVSSHNRSSDKCCFV